MLRVPARSGQLNRASNPQTEKRGAHDARDAGYNRGLVAGGHGWLMRGRGVLSCHTHKSPVWPASDLAPAGFHVDAIWQIVPGSQQKEKPRPTDARDAVCMVSG